MTKSNGETMAAARALKRCANPADSHGTLN